MAHVSFTSHLKRFFPELGPQDVQGSTVAQVLIALEDRYPGLRSYLCDDTGALRKHVNVFLDEEMVRDRLGLSDPVTPSSRLYVVQALSGG
jgi:hypothetical protein